jgi:hypothetical protein
VREEAKWLQAVFDGGRPFEKLHLAHVTWRTSPSMKR